MDIYAFGKDFVLNDPQWKMECCKNVRLASTPKFKDHIYMEYCLTENGDMVTQDVACKKNLNFYLISEVVKPSEL